MLASKLATSYVVERKAFIKLFEIVLSDQKATLLIALQNKQPIGYLLAFHRPAFYANGEVTSVEDFYKAIGYAESATCFKKTWYD